MKRKVRTDKQVKNLFWIGFVICLIIAVIFSRDISQIFLVAVLWYGYWYMTVKRPHELRKVLEEEARQEAAWREEQERLRQVREAEEAASDGEDEPEEEENEVADGEENAEEPETEEISDEN